MTDDIAPGYTDIIDKPLSFSCIEKRARKLAYPSASAVRDAFLLVFANCMTYNAPDVSYSIQAVTLGEAVMTVWHRFIHELGSTEDIA